MYQVEADANVLIVSTALNCAYDGFPTVIIGNDTDLLVMLIGHARLTDIVYMPHSGRGKLQQNVQHLQSAITAWTCYLSVLNLYA